MKVVVNPITGSYASTDLLNSNFNALANAIELLLSRDGESPNEMNASLDMNGYDVLNAGVIDSSSVLVNGVDVIEEMNNIYNSYVQLTQEITVSLAPPSGGNDGDIWYQVV